MDESSPLTRAKAHGSRRGPRTVRCRNRGPALFERLSVRERIRRARSGGGSGTIVEQSGARALCRHCRRVTRLSAAVRSAHIQSRVFSSDRACRQDSSRGRSAGRNESRRFFSQISPIAWADRMACPPAPSGRCTGLTTRASCFAAENPLLASRPRPDLRTKAILVGFSGGRLESRRDSIGRTRRSQTFQTRQCATPRVGPQSGGRLIRAMVVTA